MNAFLSRYVASFVRHLITLLAGWLASMGIEAPEAAFGDLANGLTIILTTVAMFAVTMVWSVFEKKTTGR